MKSTCLAILAFLTVCNLTVCGGQGAPEDETRDRRPKTIDDIILQRAESLLLRSILKKIENDDGSNEGLSSQPEMEVEKRQHPGKRYSQDLEKRQHPGRREEEDDEEFQDVQKRQHPGRREEEDDEEFQDVQKRQHPGKREDENMDSLVELEKRQHPGKRVSALLDEVVSENPTAHLIGELSKRQYPIEYPYNKRDYEDETEDGESDHQEALEKRQHPGKRVSDNTMIPDDFGTNSPCNALDPVKCSQANLLLHLLHNFAMQGRAVEKRQQHPKRFAPEEDLVEQE